MQEISWVILAALAIYLLIAAFLFAYQRKLIYFPTGLDPEFEATAICIDNRGVSLRGWVLNPGRAQAMIYFGGNSELITHRAEFFEDVFRDSSIYLINYRGYGASDGKPSETALFADALAIYDFVDARHQSITAYGRSLGSGIAVYLATQRPLQKLVLLTPYDSVAAVAQKVYPQFPVKLLIRDKFDSLSRAPQIDTPVFIATAELDRQIGLEHSLRLKQAITQAPVSYRMVAGAAHNDIVDFADYQTALREFVAS